MARQKIKPRKRNPADAKLLAKAKNLSKRFHGRTEVVELSPKERRGLPKYVLVAGELAEFSYAPSAKSKRGGYSWVHKVQERGMLKKQSKRRPLLVVDPQTRRAAIVTNRSGLKFDAKRGFVG